MQTLKYRAKTMEISTTSDGFKWTSVSILREELNGLQSILDKYSHFPFNIGICLRALEKNSGWTSKSRYSKYDNYLYIDIIVYEEILFPIKNDLNSKRKQFGIEFYQKFFEIMKKHEKKFPILKEINPIFLQDIEIWLLENKWIDTVS